MNAISPTMISVTDDNISEPLPSKPGILSTVRANRFHAAGIPEIRRLNVGRGRVFMYTLFDLAVKVWLKYS